MVIDLIGKLTVGGGSSKPKQDKTVTPSLVEQVVEADTGKELNSVTVEAIPDTYGAVTFENNVLHIS